MNQCPRTLVRQIALAAVLGACVPVFAFDRGKTESGVEYASGGIGLAERRELHDHKSQFSLWVTAAAKGSGAYLSDVRLKITDVRDGRVVVDRTMDGPWFFAALPPGRYEVQGSMLADGDDMTQAIKRDVQIGPGAHRQVVLRFNSKADVGPEREHPFNGNPFGASAPDRSGT